MWRTTALFAFGKGTGRGLSSTSKTSTQLLYLHVGPSGDCWTGASIFAAKHLQPDYVKSIALPQNLSADDLIETLENDPRLTQQIYDTETIPLELLRSLQDRTAQG